MPASLFGALHHHDQPQARTDSMLARTLSFDWSTTSAGPLDGWSETLRVAARMVLSASTPMGILIGPDALLLYNDAAQEIVGPDYLAALGRPAFEVVPHARDFYRNAVQAIRDGGAAHYGDQPLAITRHGVRQTAWFDIEIVMLLEEGGGVPGLLVLFRDTSDKHRTAQALQTTQKRLGAALDAGGIVGIWDLEFLKDRLVGDERLALMFGLDPITLSRGISADQVLTNVHADDRQRMMDELEATRRGIAPYRSQYRITNPDGSIRWVAVSGKRVEATASDPERLTGVAVDITDQVETSLALEKSEFTFRLLAEALPQNVFSADASGKHDFLNGRWFEFTGMPRGQVDTEDWVRFLHPDDHERTFEAWNRSLTTGQNYDIDYRYLRYDGEYRWMRAMALPVHDEQGQISRWFGTATDIHETKLLAAEREIIAGELNHRIKNLFAVVDGLISMSARNDGKSKAFASELRRRLASLSAAHNFIVAQPNTTNPALSHSLHALLQVILMPYTDSRRDISWRFAGTDLQIAERAATPVALIAHELATNAVKYGALAGHAGGISILTSCDEGRLQLLWRESWSSRPLQVVEREGFGSRMLATVVEGLLKGSLHREFHSEGMDVRIEIPLARLVEAS